MLTTTVTQVQNIDPRRGKEITPQHQKTREYIFSRGVRGRETNVDGSKLMFVVFESDSTDLNPLTHR